MNKLLRAALLLLCLVVPLQSVHALTISLTSRTDLKVHPFENVFLDLTVSGLRSGGLDATLGAFELDLIFDPNLFRELRISPAGWGSGLGSVAGGEVAANIVETRAGVLHLSAVSLLEASRNGCTFCTGPFLEDIQSDSFRLATIGLYAYNPGFPGTISFVRTSDAILADGNGDRLPDVADSVLQFKVPAPDSLTLLTLGLVAVAWMRRGGRTALRR